MGWWNLLKISLNLQNITGKYTYPRNGNSPPIVDLTFTKGQATDDIVDWTLGGDFDSDHLSTHIRLTLRSITEEAPQRLA